MARCLPSFSFALSSLFCATFQLSKRFARGTALVPDLRLSLSFLSDRQGLHTFQLLQAIINMTIKAIKANEPRTPPTMAAVSTMVAAVVVVVDVSTVVVNATIYGLRHFHIFQKVLEYIVR